MAPFERTRRRLQTGASSSLLSRGWRVVLVLAVLLLASGPLAAATRKASLGDSRWAVLGEDSAIYVEALPRKGEGLLSFARRMCGSERAAAALAKVNGRTRLLTGVRARVPLDLLTAELQLKAIRALFPKDRVEAGSWVHVAVGGGQRKSESLWQVATWFTGHGQRHGDLRSANPGVREEIAAGQSVRIPAALLRSPLRAAVPAAPTVAVTAVAPPAGASASAGRDPVAVVPVGTGSGSPSAPAPAEASVASVSPPAAGSSAANTPPPVASPPAPAASPPPIPAVASAAPRNPVVVPSTHRLEYGQDAGGDFALYRLRPGEALYSSVVVRFTGRIHAEDVNALAIEVARRSGIRDVTDIPIGYPVKIPFDVLLPEFLPVDHPRRREYEATLAASAELAQPVRAVGLQGVTVILDAGHGGRDIGASFGGVWESIYAYDVVLRIKRSLETHTAATVLTTTVDDAGYAVLERDVLPFSRSHRVLTTPPYPIEDSKTGVHLRWYFANSVLRQRLSANAEPDKVVFLSVHADSLHPSLRGAMVYIPGAEGGGGSFGKSGSVYASRREVREQPTVRFSSRELLESEGRSRELARQLIEGFARQGLAIHPFKPIRESVIRSRREWVPAVLRYNAVPAKLLLEICNLANEEDRRLIQTRNFREQVAEGVVQGLLAYFGYDTALPRAVSGTTARR